MSSETELIIMATGLVLTVLGYILASTVGGTTRTVVGWVLTPAFFLAVWFVVKNRRLKPKGPETVWRNNT